MGRNSSNHGEDFRAVLVALREERVGRNISSSTMFTGTWVALLTKRVDRCLIGAMQTLSPNMEAITMPKLRKMLGSVDSPECIALMRLIETQSKATLAAWAVGYAKEHYLPLYRVQCPGDGRLNKVVADCEAYLSGGGTLALLKPVLKAAGLLAREVSGAPVAQAAARAVSVACATVQTPTNALGFLFYGAAAAAYARAGLAETAPVYDELAGAEFRQALDSLGRAAVPGEPHPVRIQWNC